MTEAETQRYAQTLTGASTVVEYGCGGSTLLALRTPGVQRIVSVETDKAWIESLRGRPDIRAAEASGHLHLVHINVGPVGKWGHPLDKSHPGALNYPEAPWLAVPKADVVLIDGRFRVASTIASLKRATPATQVVIHDFWTRSAYHVILPLVDCVARVQDLAVLRRKAKFDHRLADDLARQYARDDL